MRLLTHSVQVANARKLNKASSFRVELTGYETIKTKPKEDKIMQSKCNTKIEVNKVEIKFTNGKIWTATYFQQ